MILINKVTPFANEAHQKDLIECIIHNSDISFITSIVVFYNNTNIVLPNNNKVKLVIKNGYTDREIIEYCKRIYNDDVLIYSNPFIKFNNSLINLNSVKHPIKVDIDCYIFSKDIIFEKGNNIDELFLLTTSNNKISIERKHLWTKEVQDANNFNLSISSSKPKSVLEKNIRKKEAYLNSKRQNLRELPKIDVIIVSVDYNDFLEITLKNTTSILNVTVVTSSSDTVCQELCKQFGANCIITDRMYENGDIFNKGKAINEGIKSLKNPDWILLLDADIYLQSDFLEVLKNSDIRSQSLLLCKRLILEDNDSFIRWQNGEDVGKMERSKGFGYFQMFNIKKFNRVSNIFPEEYSDASLSDIVFRDLFSDRLELNTYVVHLGKSYQNWTGRKTKKFIEEEFNINTYFDKIYCINLKDKKERWNRVNAIFNDLSINVERFDAINGDLISDEYFKSITDKYNPENLIGEEASLIGLIENKKSLACLLSHLEIIKEAKLNNYKKILIFEDDVFFCENFNFRIKEISKLNWKLIYLGASQFNWQGISTSNGFYSSKKTLGTFAYGIDSSIYEELISLLETKRKSIDNLLSEIQENHYGQCYTFYPNIVISNVENSDIRESKNIIDYANKVKWNLNLFDIKSKIKILLVPDVEDWAFDNIAKSIIKYNPYPETIEYTIAYSRNIKMGITNVDLKSWDLIYVMFEAERVIPDADNVIRGCYSAFWLENSNFSEEVLAQYFSKCKGGVFANDYLYKSLGKYLPKDFNSEIIHDSTDENLFYPIDNQKNENFTAIFVGNTERPIKNFNDIKWICEQSKIELIVCRDIKNSDLVNYYNKADICINFSTFEGGPQTFLESSLCEVPMLIRNNNELSKLIPCFTGSTKEELVDIINYLKLNRSKCLEVGKKARIEVLENFTYKKTANKFANFFIQTLNKGYLIEGLLDKKDLSNDLTIFIIRAGENPNYEDCLNSLNNQTVKFQIKEIRNIAPMSKAFQKMIDDCETKYYIQVDEDMILEKNTIEKIYKRLVSSESNISTIAHMLKDTHLDFNLYGIKGYKHNILKNYPYNLDIISCEVEQVKRMKDDGYEIMMVGEVVGKHSPKWTTSLIYERYFDLMEKWKNFKYDWLGELPSKLFQIFQNDPSEINLYALMGAMTSLSSKEMIRKREKNFLVKDENFERIENILQVKEFKFIVNKEEETFILGSMFGK